MKTERIVASPTGTMERVLTEEGFDPDRVRPLQSCGLQVVLRHHRITLSALASTLVGIVSPICFAVFTIDGRFEFRRLLDGKIGARSTSGETVS